MITQLQQNLAQLIGSFHGITTIYVKQYGPGNLRIGPVKDDLQNTAFVAAGGVQDGISQALADKWQQYFWQGDLYVISDAAGPVAFIVPSWNFSINRLNGSHPTQVSPEVQKDHLSTY
jgi:hypothetical protein